jgi:hypothetical protein
LENQPQNVARSGAQRHSNADFPAAPADQKSDDAVDAHHCQQ